MEKQIVSLLLAQENHSKSKSPNISGVLLDKVSLDRLSLDRVFLDMVSLTGRVCHTIAILLDFLDTPHFVCVCVFEQPVDSLIF